MIDDHSDEIDVNAAYYWTLPCAQFHGLWDSLVFDSDIKDRLLHYGCAMLSYSEHGVDSTIISSNRVILLHGPPGTGKTTLCKAISQKLSVRMSTSYDHTVLIEINTHSLFSKYFSESGKLVTKMFNKIGEVIADPKTLVCVLIDEVESLAHSRAAASSGSEPSDSIRVVNSVLTQLDLLKTKPNVLILTTSNITGAIDIAFVDRADIKQLIPCPSAFAIYTIHYSCLQELIRVKKNFSYY
ncbi:hypothetical protein AAG570_011940 [Ranatra chinensis]|uniref:AAA+ ATPase domain-containing protein n=1 Tax=Ranatra chinensis TaxID=642074 RepID=A0ABD0YJE7_9HEMI